MTSDSGHAPGPTSGQGGERLSSTSWGRVADDGTVYVRTASGERAVGSWQAGDARSGLEHFARRFDDLVTEVELLEQRLANGKGDPAATARHAEEMRAQLATAHVVGDIDGLDARLGNLVAATEAAAEQRAAERAATKQRAIEAKEALVAEAEHLAQQDGAWKAAGDRLRAIVDEWRAIKGIDRRTDDELWQRFRSARDTFTRRRGAHFAALDEQRNLAKHRKEELIAEAEKLSDSTDWGPTAAQLKALMREWKEVGRAPKSAEDALWQRFRAAQDAFFTSRSEAFSARDAEQLANQQRKEELITEAEALDAGRDPTGAQNALRKIQEQYDAVGHVPRDAMRPLDERMRAAEQRVRSGGRQQRPTAPENPLLQQMRDAVTKAESALERARASGDSGRIEEAESALRARREWLSEAEQSARH